MTAPRSGLFLFILAALTAIGPFSMQIFLPALPTIREDFAVSGAVAQLPLSVSMVAIAVATLAYGPASDRFGRRPLVIMGFALYLAGSVLCAVAPDIVTLIIGRALQGAGGAAGMVLARAIVRDVYSRERSATVIAYLTTAMVIAPMVAPTIGGLLTDFASWRANFAFVAAIGLVIGVLVAMRLPETLAAKGSETDGIVMSGRVGRLVRQPIFWGYALNASFALSVFFAFLSGGPYVMADVFKRPPTEYGLYFIIVSFGIMGGSFTAARMSERVGIDRMIVGGSMLALAGVGLSVALLSAGLWHPIAMFGPATLVAFATGITMPNAQAGAVSVDPTVAGAASGIAGFVQMLIGAAVTQAVGMILNGTPYPMLLIMLACSTLALAGIAVPLWRHRRTAAGA